MHLNEFLLQFSLKINLLFYFFMEWIIFLKSNFPNLIILLPHFPLAFEGSLTQHSKINIYTAYFGILKHVDYLLKMFIKKLKERLRCVRPLLIFYCEWRSNEKRVSVELTKIFFYYFSKYTKKWKKKKLIQYNVRAWVACGNGLSVVGTIANCCKEIFRFQNEMGWFKWL